MAKQKKSTIKFKTKGHLSASIQKRKAGQRIKRWKGEREDKKEAAAHARAEAHGQKNVEDLSVDEFLDGDFLEPGTGLSEDEDEIVSGSEDGLDELEDDPTDDGAAVPEGAEEEESSDDDEADTTDDPVAAQNKALRSEIKSHKAQLEALKEQDPEFYDYLQSTDTQLLEFNASDEDDDMDDGREPAARTEGEEPSTSGATVTSAMVEAWCAAAKEKASPAAMRQLLKAYRAACHYGDAEDDEAVGLKIGSSAAFNRLMLFVLKEADGILWRMLGLDKSSVTAETLAKSPRWRKVEVLARSYLGNSLHLLSNLTEGGMIGFVLRRLRASVLLLAPFERTSRKLLKAALGHFGGGDGHTRIQAVLLLRAIATAHPAPALDNVLRGAYRAYSSNAKFVGPQTIPHINFMATCCVELYGLDLRASYEHAFGHIRALAVLLRNALTQKSEDALRQVYCWQAVNCMELWAKVLAAHRDRQELQPLVHPVVQLTLGAARLLPSPRYFPLRLRLARTLNKLAAATGLFIPLAPVLLEVLGWADLNKPPSGGAGRPPNLALQLKVSKSAMKTTAFQEEIINQVMELLAEHLGQWAYSVAFPELSYLTLLQLKKFAKSTPSSKFRAAARAVVDAIDRNTVLVGRARDQVDFSPKDVQEVNRFMQDAKDAGRSPVEQLAKKLAKKHEERAKLLDKSTDDVPAGSDDDEDELVGLGAPDESDDGGEDEEMDMMKASQDARKANTERKRAAEEAAAAAAEEDEDEGDDVMADDDGHEDDVLQDYVLSDDDDSDPDDAPAAKPPPKGKKAHERDAKGAKQGGKGERPKQGGKGAGTPGKGGKEAEKRRKYGGPQSNKPAEAFRKGGAGRVEKKKRKNG